MRKKIVAGNWKMNTDIEEALHLALNITKSYAERDTEKLVILAPPFTHLYPVKEVLKDITNFFLGAQNCHQEEYGAYTGEVSAPMLSSIGVRYVIIGHSERRQYFHESDELLAAKLKAALAHGLKPIFCCGEPEEVRSAGSQNGYVERQLQNSLFSFTRDEVSEMIIAYEPIWAIGTGKNATPEQAQQMHAHIRSLLEKQYDKELAENTSILYGGSCKPGNSKELFSQADIDGGLIGGASLKAEDFVQIINNLQ